MSEIEILERLESLASRTVPKEWLTTSEAAQYLNLDPSEVRRQSGDKPGAIKRHKFSGERGYRYYLPHLREWVNRDKTQAQSLIEKRSEGARAPTFDYPMACLESSPSALYFIQPVGGGPIKIGIALNPRRRLSQLNVSSFRRLGLLAVVQGAADREVRIHEALAPHRLNGEWFENCGEVLELIKDTLMEADVSRDDIALVLRRARRNLSN